MPLDEISKLLEASAPALTKGVVALGAAVPFTGLVKRMLGPAADELAAMWQDQIRLYRYGRQVKCVERAEEMAREAGFTPSAVPPKILFPLLEGASVEEEETLHDMWAALLANAASPKKTIVRSVYINLLREMSADEAGLLNLIDSLGYSDLDASVWPKKQDKAEKRNPLKFSQSPRHVIKMKFAVFPSEMPIESEVRLEACLMSLQHSGLVTGGLNYCLTGRGMGFLDACRPPNVPKKRRNEVLEEGILKALKTLNREEHLFLWDLVNHARVRYLMEFNDAEAIKGILEKTGSLLIEEIPEDEQGNFNPGDPSYRINSKSAMTIAHIIQHASKPGAKFQHDQTED